MKAVRKIKFIKNVSNSETEKSLKINIAGETFHIIKNKNTEIDMLNCNYYK